MTVLKVLSIISDKKFRTNHTSLQQSPIATYSDSQLESEVYCCFLDSQLITLEPNFITKPV